MKCAAIALAYMCACGRIDFAPPPSIPVTLAVAPVYPVSGADWNAYVMNDGADATSASDTACDPAARPFSACLHGGELRAATVEGVTSCRGLVMIDALDAFDWTCRIVDGTVTFYSTLKPTRGLRDLVTAAGWRDDNVVVSGTGVGQSVAGPWWNNPVAALPDNSAGTSPLALATPDQIYVLESDRLTSGYQLTADGIAIVTLANAELIWNGAPVQTMLTASGAARLWLEVSANLANAQEGVRITGGSFEQLYGSRFINGGTNFGGSVVIDGVASSQIRHVRAIDSGWLGLVVGDTASSDDNYFADVGVSSAGSDGIELHFGQHDVFDGVIVANCGGVGIRVGPYCDGGGAQLNTFAGVRAFNNVNEGMYINTQLEHVLGAVLVNNGNNGMRLDNECYYATFAVVAATVTAFNAISGISIGDHTMTFNADVSVGNGAFGIDLGDFATWSNVATSNSTMGDIDQNAGASFAGGLLVSSSTSCVNPMGYAGVSGASCQPIGGSTASVSFVGSLLGNFVAQTTDATNASGGTGVATYPTTPGFDWLEFDNPYRIWGRWGTPGRWTSGPGSILDFRLVASATRLFDDTGAVSVPNDPFVAGARCPAAVNGSNTVTNDNNTINGGPPNQVYLLDAIEIVSPSSPGWSAAGNHDGLCESGEHCLYTPNFGAYQGDGTLGTCTFVDGMIAGVTMYGYSSNGV